MVNVNFNLRKQRSKKAEVIYLVLRWNGNYYRYSTKFKILPKNWDGQKQRVRAVITEPLKDSINKHIGDMDSIVRKIYADAIATNNFPTKEYFKNAIDKWTGRKTDEKPNFWKFVNSYIETSNERIDPKTGRKISIRTIQEYNTTKGLLLDFEKENNESIEFDKISVNTLSDFRDFLTTVKRYTRKDKKTGEEIKVAYSLNNIAKHIDNFRQFLRAAAAEKIAFDIDTIDNKKFYNAREAAYNVYLNETELRAIETLDFSNNQRLDKARDLFLIGCYTGLRVSDYNNIKPYNIRGKNIELYQTKTGGRVVIPILPTVEKILSKYNGNTPPKISDQKLNEYIKEICRIAGIKEMTEKQRTHGGAKETQVLEKWEIVSSHTARRSYASNMIKRGLPIQTIMKATGHSKESTFIKYCKLSAEEHAEIMRNHWNQIK